MTGLGGGLGLGGGGGGGGGGGQLPLRRHTSAPTMRESEVKGKLARFLAGMRAYERQQRSMYTYAGGGGGGGSGSGSNDYDNGTQQPQEPPALPPVLSEFIAWAGDLLAGDSDDSGDSSGSGHGSSSSSRGKGGRGVSAGMDLEARARRYVGGSGRLGLGSSSQTAAAALTSASVSAAQQGQQEQDDWCCICLNAFSDTSVHDELGELVQTVGCGHRFHAVCFARHLEASEQDPWCPMCRGGPLAVRFI